MTYLMCDLRRRVLPVVTFTVISFLVSDRLVCARPQEGSYSPSQNYSNNSREALAERIEPVISTAPNDRNDQAHILEAETPAIIKSEENSTFDKTKLPTEQKIYGDISIDSGLDFGRAAIESSTRVNPTVNTLKPITKQNLQSNSAADIVADVRTPPKVKSQIVHSHVQSFVTPGKGEAIPVVLDGSDEVALEKISSDNFKYTHNEATPSSGLSTWILLNSDAASTPFSHKKGQKPTLFDIANLTSSTENAKKPVKSATPVTTTERIKSKIETILVKKPERKPIATIQKVNQTQTKKPPTTARIDPEEVLITTATPPQDSKFKNKTPVVVGKIPTTNSKETVNSTTPMSFVEFPTDNGTRLGTPVVTFPHVPPVKQKSNATTTRKPSTAVSSGRPDLVLISSGVPVKLSSTLAVTNPENLTPAATTEDGLFEITTETSTKKSSTSTNKKKKKKKNKNKSKRRRPTKKPSKIQSKISEEDNSTSKLPMGMPNGSRPLSTRIYNYLAREVMPNVGVGLVGLMLTAGLAGLLLYPFGAAVPVRRNYEKPNPSYNLNDYPPVGEVDNAQPEESVFSQVLSGMSNTMNQYSREQPDVLYKTHPKYKPARFDNTNTYNHHKEGGGKYTTETVVEDSKYSELGDVVSGPHESVKFTNFDINDSIKYPMENSQPSPSYSSIDLTTNSQNEPVYHKYNNHVNEPIKHESPIYSTLGEYASYNSPNEPVRSPVYTGETYDYKNHKTDDGMQEFKVGSDMEVVTQGPENQTTTTKNKHEQPSFAALEGIPKNYRTLQTSIRFEDTASVLPMNQDFVPSDGVFASSIEHGPRNMKLRRRKRQTSSENEVDSVLVVEADRTTESAQPAVQFISTEPAAEKYGTSTEEVNATTLSATTLKSEVGTMTFENDIKAYNSSDADMWTESNNTSVIGAVSSENATRPEESPTTGTKFEKLPNITNHCEDCDLSNYEEHPPAPQPVSIGTIFKKILDFKFRVGLEIIRATSEMITKYFSKVQQKMSEAIRDIQRSAFRASSEKKSRTKAIKKRNKRYVSRGR